MMKRLLLISAAFVVSLSLSLNAQEGKDNLIPDPAFKKFGYDPTKHREVWKERWIPHQIKTPSEWKLDGGKAAVELKGGETFLHSPRYAVKPGQKFSIAVTAEGKGTLSVQCLWWTAEGDMAQPHRTIPIEPVELKGDSQRVEGTDTAPEGASEAYIRIVVQDGTITVSQPEVKLAK